jgi:hypothetical protein
VPAWLVQIARQYCTFHRRLSDSRNPLRDYRSVLIYCSCSKPLRLVSEAHDLHVRNHRQKHGSIAQPIVPSWIPLAADMLAPGLVELFRNLVALGRLSQFRHRSLVLAAPHEERLSVKTASADSDAICGCVISCLVFHLGLDTAIGKRSQIYDLPAASLLGYKIVK